MRAAYVDTSCFVAIALGEAGAASIARRLAAFDALYSSSFLDAELSSVMSREGVAPDSTALDRIAWVVPDRPLHAEIAQVLAAGHVRGTDCWHLASALYLVEERVDISFLTLDARQHAVARKLGFQE